MTLKKHWKSVHLKKNEKDDISLQRRVFILTIWPKSADADSGLLLKHLEDIILSRKEIKYSAGQLEYGCGGKGRHLQVYIETYKSIRGRTVLKWFKNELLKPPHIENVINPEKSRNYCIKEICDKCGEGAPLCGRVEDTEPVIFGVYKPKKQAAKKRNSEVKTCAQLITEGYGAEYIAFHYPQLFLKYGNKIVSTIQYRQSYKERQEFLSEEE